MHWLFRTAVLLLSAAPLTLPAEPWPADFRVLAETHFEAGLDSAIVRQGATDESLTVVPKPSGGGAGQCLRVYLRKQDDFTKVANGAPRCELAFGRQFRLVPGNEYLADWSTFLPGDFVFDLPQMESLTQIHGGASKGSPPFMLALKGETYQVELRGGEMKSPQQAKHQIGAAGPDLGKWVHWRLRYVPDATGAKAVVQLWHEGALVLDASGEPNAYAGDREAYWKMGVYKWDWRKQPSTVESRTIYYGDLKVGVLAAETP